MKAIKEHAIITSIIICILGVILFVWPGGTLNVVCRLIGISLVLLAIVGARTFYLNRDDKSYAALCLIATIAAGLVGLIFLINPEFIQALLPILCGIAIVLNGIANLQQALKIRKIFPTDWQPHLVLAIATIAFGILIFGNPFATINLWVKVLGAILIYDGISNFLTARKLH